MQSLQGKTALITGAASGIGKAIGLALANEGVNLYLLDVDEVGLSKVIAETRRLGIDVIGRYCDVSQLSQIQASVAHVLDRCGGVDILVNNAGITYYGQTDKMESAVCDKLLAINLNAPIHFTRELLPTLLKRPEAHVLNIASFFGLIGTRKTSLYTSSKFGLVGFSESLRAEYGRRGLGVTTMCPGFVDTGLFDSAPLGTDQSKHKQPPRWMLTTPEKIAQRAVKAIYRNQAVVIPQLYARLAHWGKRLFPGVYDWANHLSRKKHKQQEDAAGQECFTKRAA